MRNHSVWVFIAGSVLIVMAWRAWGPAGIVAVITGIVLWMLLHFTRMMHVLKKASSRPKGHVGSAVMLNARLKPGVNLLHVLAMTQSLGEPLSARDAQPEVFRWTDEGGSHVTCEFNHGKLARWELWRPPVEEGAAPEAPPEAGQ